MKKEVITVPRNKFLLNLLAEMGERTKNAWIFLHRDLVNCLWESAERKNGDYNYTYNFIWTSDEFEDVVITIDVSYQAVERDPEYHAEWIQVYAIKSKNIEFRKRPKDPDEILFFKPEK